MIQPVGFRVSGCLESMASVEEAVASLTADLTESQFHAPAQGGGWSIGHCIEHIVLAGSAMLPIWDVAIRNARAASHSHTPSETAYGWLQRLLLRAVRNESCLRRKTSASLEPCSRASIRDSLAQLRSTHHEVTRRLEAARTLDTKHSKVASPIAPWMRHALGCSFDLVIAHELRHLKQATRAKGMLPK